jgi:hypothetical protein
VVASGFAPEELPALERAIRRRDPSAILHPYHTASPPERGAAQRLTKQA